MALNIKTLSKTQSKISDKKEINDYDSMIENGTSESSDDEQMEQSDGSDSGVPRQEVVPPKTHKNASDSKKMAHKRKIDMDNNPTPKVMRKEKGEKVKPPTLEEINELKETRNLFHSNLFRLQIKEMLNELKIKEKYTKFLNSWLEKFKCFIADLHSESTKQDVNEEMEWTQSSGLKVPFSLEQLNLYKQKKYQFQFLKPTAVPYYTGSTALGTMMSSSIVADMVVTMPPECFQKGNHLNLIYDHKRALYLTYIGHQMLLSKHFEGLTLEHLRFNYFQNNPLKPYLEVTPPTEGGRSMAKQVSIRVFVTPDERTFKLSRFVPWNSNIRTSLFGDDDEDALPLATPHYNANALFDLTMACNQSCLRRVFCEHKNFQEGLILLKVWLRQRQFHVGFNAFNSHILALFIVYLFEERKLHSKMSSYQVARTVWNNLVHSNWDEKNRGISLCKETTPQHPTLEQFHVHYEVVFIDVSGFYNVCAGVTLEMYRRVRHEAKVAMDLLNNMKLNSFQLLFMTKYPIYTQIDHLLKIQKRDAVEQLVALHVPIADKCDYALHTFPQLMKLVVRLLKKGLGERVSSMLPIEQTFASWPCQSRPPNGAEHLHLGIVLNAEKALEVLDKGPESISEEASEFRQFWGEKAELRRFQDGSITESVVWAKHSDTVSVKRLIVRSIVQHLLAQHFQLDPTDIEYIGGEFDVAFKLTPAFKTDKLKRFEVPQNTDAEALSLQVIRSFDDLSRKMYSLTELPLEIVSIGGISPVFRYCEPEPILPQARLINDQIYAPNVQYGVIQLGLSSKWPSELKALRALKTAFYIQIAKLLREKFKLKVQVTYDGILVLKQGYCFGLEIAHPKEVVLLKKTSSERGITQYVDCPASIGLEKRHSILPKLTGALHSLYHEYSCFGATVMIAKRWLYSQLIDDHLWPDECTEILIASQFVMKQAQQVPSSPQTGFIRFLHLLATTDWRNDLFVVNFNNSMDANELGELERRFNEERDAFPPICIATSYDQGHAGLLWTTKEQPNEFVISRVTLLARNALKAFESSLLATDEPFLRTSSLFKASNEGYHLVIQMKPDLVANTLAYEFGSPFIMLATPNWRLPLAGTNFLRHAILQLREAYSEFAAFFYNPRGGKEIAIVWRPDEIFAKKPFKVTEVNGCVPVLDGDGKSVQCQKMVLIDDFKFILRDFYLRIGTPSHVFEKSKNISQKPKATQRYYASESVEELAPKLPNKMARKDGKRTQMSSPAKQTARLDAKKTILTSSVRQQESQRKAKTKRKIES